MEKVNIYYLLVLKMINETYDTFFLATVIPVTTTQRKTEQDRLTPISVNSGLVETQKQVVVELLA